MDHHIDMMDLLSEHSDLSGDSLSHRSALDSLELDDKLVDDLSDVDNLLLQDDGSLANNLVDSLEDDASWNRSRSMIFHCVHLSHDSSDSVDESSHNSLLSDDLDSDVSSLGTSDLGKLLFEGDEDLSDIGDVLSDLGDLSVEVVNISLLDAGERSDLSVSDGSLSNDSDELLVDVDLSPEIDDLSSQLSDNLGDRSSVLGRGSGTLDNKTADLPGGLEDFASDDIDLLSVHSLEVGESGRNRRSVSHIGNSDSHSVDLLVDVDDLLHQVGDLLSDDSSLGDVRDESNLADEDVDLSVDLVSHNIQLSDLNSNLLDESSLVFSDWSGSSGAITGFVVSTFAETTSDSGVTTTISNARLNNRR